MNKVFLSVLVLSITGRCVAQDTEAPLVASAVAGSATDLGEVVPEILEYEALNQGLGGDSVRQCAGYGCTGWVEDRYKGGTLKHRGYYNEGQLLVYKNFFENGAVEREFKAVDNVRSLLRTFYPDGKPRTETKFVRGVAMEYAEYYSNGNLRYTDEKHKSDPYYLVMDLFAEDGKPISTMHVVDKKHVIFEQCDYWPNGVKRVSGQAQFDPSRQDSRRIGTWTYYDESGRPVTEETYIDGLVHTTREL